MKTSRPFLPRIALVDPMCRTGYVPKDLDHQAMGGTEATVIRVCTALSSHFEMMHFQNGRHETVVSEMGVVQPLSALSAAAADGVIVINSWKLAVALRKSLPDTPISLWLHIFPGRHNRGMGAALAGADISVICVSRTHAARLRKFLSHGPVPQITHIYNPLCEGLMPDPTPRNRDTLLFASSPHKGLDEVLTRFSQLKQRIPSLKLALADPGYMNWPVGPIPGGVICLHQLRHAAVIRQMRKCLCLFYPQTRFHETFGLVMAEANAVGTPVLVQKGIGANDEVVTDPDQRIDGNDVDQMHRRLLEWRERAPSVTSNPAFRLERVTSEWLQLIDRMLSRSGNSPIRKVA